MSDRIIDVHSHPLLPSYRKALTGGSTAEDAVVDGVPLPPWSVERHIGMMDRSGIDICILSLPEATQAISGGPARRLCRAMNRELAETVATNPTRFGALATLPVDDMDAALEELAYGLDELKLDGVALATNDRGRYLGEPHYDPLLAELDRRGATLFVHPAASPGFDPETSRLNVSVLEFMFDTTRMVATMVLSGTRRRFPRVNVVATHGGGTIPYLATRLALVSRMPWAFKDGPKLSVEEVAAGLGSFHFDLTASASATSLDALRRLVPADRLLLGFDFPMMPEETIGPAQGSFADYAGFDDREKSRIRFANALELFPRFGQAGAGDPREGVRR